MKKICLTLLFMFVNCGQLRGVEDALSTREGHEKTLFSTCKTQKNVRFIQIVNDIPELVEALPLETKEFQESIHDTLEVNSVMPEPENSAAASGDVVVNGVTIKPGRVVTVPLKNDYLTITVKSKKSFIECIDWVPGMIKWISKKTPSVMTTYFGFRCHIASDVDVVHLAMPVLYGCDALKKKEPRTFSYKRPRGIQIWLKEIIECY